MNRVRFALPSPAPEVAIVIPSRDRASLLRSCIESIRNLTTYPRYSIVVVDNGSQEPDALELLRAYAADGITVLRDDSPFNFSALNNRAVATLSAEFVCLLNNDVEVVTPGWLEEMVSLAARPGVGAVGARLWFPDRTLQHGGLILGIAGFAGYAHRRLPAGETGYAHRAVVHQAFSALTAACLVVRRSLYNEVGGFDEELAVAFNDVDFCLRLRDAGHRNVWTPYAELTHDESHSRKGDTTPEKLRRFQGEMDLLRARWGASLFDDPAYSPNLTLDAEDFSPAWPPRVGI
jgi:GT2 family glycosyltransferase